MNLHENLQGIQLQMFEMPVFVYNESQGTFVLEDEKKFKTYKKSKRSRSVNQYYSSGRFFEA